MFKIKEQIDELAKNAVLIAEREIGSGKGKQKKEIAVNYILKNLPFSELVKSILAIFLSGFIDNSIEAAIVYMNSLHNSKGE